MLNRSNFHRYFPLLKVTEYSKVFTHSIFDTRSDKHPIGVYHGRVPTLPIPIDDAAPGYRVDRSIDLQANMPHEGHRAGGDILDIIPPDVKINHSRLVGAWPD